MQNLNCFDVRPRFRQQRAQCDRWCSTSLPRRVFLTVSDQAATMTLSPRLCLDQRGFHGPTRGCQISGEASKRADSCGLSDNAAPSASAYYSVRHLRGYWVDPLQSRGCQHTKLYTRIDSRMRRTIAVTCLIVVALAIYQSLEMQALKNVVVVGGSYVGSVSRSVGGMHFRD